MDEFDDTPRAGKRKQKPIIEGNTIILIIACIFGVIIMGVALNALSNETKAELNAPPTTIPTTVITLKPTVIQTLTVQPTVTVNITQTPTVVETIDPNIERTTVLNYTFNSNQYRMSVPLDDKLADIYNTKKSTYVCMRYNNDPSPCTQTEKETYYRNYVADPYQNGVLNDIVGTIRTQSINPDDQVRIAISLVQQIPYDTNKSNNIGGTTMRYPYMAIYDNKGVCSEKSMLLAGLLQRLGYGVVLFHFVPEKHMAVGIEAPSQYAYRGTGYAFIETTVPSIPTDSKGNYTNIGKLTSMPLVYKMNTGRTMTSIGVEANDLSEYNRIVNITGNTLSTADYTAWENINKKYGLVIK